MSRKASEGGRVGGQNSETTLTLPLKDFWIERISRKEAIRRLSSRPLDKSRFKRIVASLHDYTDHYISFGNGFREYAQPKNGRARVLLMLPSRRLSSLEYQVAMPLVHTERTPAGRVRHFSLFQLHHFATRRGTLFEEGVAKRQFTHVSGPRLVPIDVSFLKFQPEPGHPGGTPCCDLCEFVHSILAIHSADWLCCFLGDGCGTVFQ